MTPITPPDLFDRVEPGPRKQGKRQILRSALACFEAHGVEATTIEQVRAHADSSIGSIYHHFGNKEGLIAALYLAALDDQQALMVPALQAATSAREAIAALVGSYLSWVAAQPALARLLFQVRRVVADGPHGDALAQRNRTRYGGLSRWLRDGMADGSLRSLPLETCAALLIGPAESYCKAWLGGRVSGLPTDHASVFIAAAWRSLGMTD